MGRRDRNQFQGNFNGPPHWQDKIAAIPSGAHILNEPPQMPPNVTIDGFEFIGPPACSLVDVFLLSLVFQARAGDETIIKMLTTFKVKVVDLNGKQAWPIEEVTPTETAEPEAENPPDSSEGTR